MQIAHAGRKASSRAPWDGGTQIRPDEATGWQTHTCRAFLTGQRKKGRELIRSKHEDDKTSYRLAAPLAYD